MRFTAHEDDIPASNLRFLKITRPLLQPDARHRSTKTRREVLPSTAKAVRQPKSASSFTRIFRPAASLPAPGNNHWKSGLPETGHSVNEITPPPNLGSDSGEKLAPFASKLEGNSIMWKSLGGPIDSHQLIVEVGREGN